VISCGEDRYVRPVCRARTAAVTQVKFGARARTAASPKATQKRCEAGGDAAARSDDLRRVAAARNVAKRQ
jgi:hypothetical protein